MKFSGIIISVLTTLSLFYCTSLEHIERHAGSPSLLDFPGQGLYYGFVVNNSSHFIEFEILSLKEKSILGPTILLPCPKSAIKKNFSSSRWSKNEYPKRPANVISLWLKLGEYKVSIRNRDDLNKTGAPGPLKYFTVVLDKDYVKKSPGPFTFEIEDDPREM